MTSMIGFSPDTFFDTPEGKLSVEWLRDGDLIDTLDAGPQEILWIGRGQYCPSLSADAVRLPAQGPNALCIAPNQGILVTGWQLELNFGCDEMLVEARHLSEFSEIFDRTSSGAPDCVHVLLAHPALVKADEVWVSLPACNAQFLDSLTSAAQKQVVSAGVPIHEQAQAVRPLVQDWEARELGLPLLSMVATTSGEPLAAPLQHAETQRSTFGSLAM